MDSPDRAYVAAGATVASLAVVQLFTGADPVGRCLRFWKQLAAQVSRVVVAKDKDCPRKYGRVR